jgi:hypothetical protein
MISQAELYLQFLIGQRGFKKPVGVVISWEEFGE